MKDKPQPPEYELCRLCNGKGQLDIFQTPELNTPCEICDGWGWLPKLPPMTEPLSTEIAAIYWCRRAGVAIEFERGTANTHNKVKVLVSPSLPSNTLRALSVADYAFLMAVNRLREYWSRLFPDDEEEEE